MNENLTGSLQINCFIVLLKGPGVDRTWPRGRCRATGTVFVDSSHSSRMAQTGRWMSAVRDAIVHSVMEDEVYEYHAAELSSGPCFCSQADFNDKPDSLFFNDGKRKIDFILVYEDEDKMEFEKRHTFARRKVGFQDLLGFSDVSLSY